jgi:hypothetical protein
MSLRSHERRNHPAKVTVRLVEKVKAGVPINIESLG